MTNDSLCLFLGVLILVVFHKTARAPVVELARMLGRLMEAVEALLGSLNAWVVSHSPGKSERPSAWNVFQGVVVACIAGVLAYVEFVVLNVAFQVLLPEEYAGWLALSGTALTMLVGYGCHAAASRRFRGLLRVVSVAFVVFVGALAGMRQLGIEKIDRLLAAASAQAEDTSANGSLVINDPTAGQVPAVAMSAPLSPAITDTSREVVLAAAQTMLYAVGELCAVYLSLDLAGAGILAVFLLPFRAVVLTPLAVVRIVNLAGIPGIPAIVANWLFSAAEEIASWLKGIPAAAERFSVAWKERHVRIVYAKERLRATLEAEQAVHKEYLNQYQVAQEQFLKVLLEKQLERGLAVASEAILLNQEVALQKMREQDSQWAIPAWTGLQAGMNGKRKSAHTSFN